MMEGRSVLDYLLVALAVLVVVGVTVWTVRLIVRPGEKDPGHIKRRILRDGEEERPKG
jgi:hypothetical protein